MGKYEDDVAMSRQAYRDGMISKKQLNADLARYAKEQKFRRQNRKTGPKSAVKSSVNPAAKKTRTKMKGEKHSASYWRKKFFGLKKRK